jgi:hypothetical protein
MDQFSKDLSDLNVAMASALPANSGSSAVAGAPRLASPPQNTGKQTQLVVPTDKAVAQSMEDALPIVKKVIGIHQCAKQADSFRLLNVYGVPGKNFQTEKFDYTRHFLAGGKWQYHNEAICPSVQMIDQWSMPALNALRFRVIYFADDSGESSSFVFSMLKAPEGNWQLQDFRRAN